MIRPVLILLAALLVVLIVGSADGSFADPTVADGKAKAPVDNWGDWWPSSQFGENDRLSRDAITAGDKAFSSVDYGSVGTPWGLVTSRFSVTSDNEISFSMTFFRSGKVGETGAWQEPVPEKGDVHGVIVQDGQVVREAKNPEPVIGIWFGRTNSMQGTLSMTFAALPADFGDYWFRIDMLKQRHWFLIPYGLGMKAEEGLSLPTIQGDSPKRPSGIAPGDVTHEWSSVSYELGRIEGKGWSVEAFVSNPFDSEISIRLYQSPGRWTLSHPRTTAVFNWPEGYSRFSSWTSIQRNDASALHRTDTYKFWRTPFDTRGWGVLRVTVEEHKFDKVVPSSLFNYCHGRTPRE